MRGILFKLLPLVLVVSCATAKPGIQIQYVDRPVITVEKCLKGKDVPTRPEKLKGSLPAELETALSLALAKISEWTRYGNKMDVIVKNCTP